MFSHEVQRSFLVNKLLLFSKQTFINDLHFSTLLIPLFDTLIFLSEIVIKNLLPLLAHLDFFC